jgi:hypothetical protein
MRLHDKVTIIITGGSAPVDSRADRCLRLQGRVVAGRNHWSLGPRFHGGRRR